MYRFRGTYFTVLILCCYFIDLSSVRCRKYDLESEAVKLYGENLNIVLKRFRKTPEYMSIFNDKIKDLQQNFVDLIHQVQYAYWIKLEKKIKEMILSGEKEKEKSKSLNKMVYRAAASHRRQDGDELNSTTTMSSLKRLAANADLPPLLSDARAQYIMGLRRQNKEESKTSTTLSPVEILDAHAPLQSSLTIAEKNYFKDLGFEFAGNAIHKMIENMGPGEDYNDEKSTRMPNEGQPVSRTTQHVTKHKVLSTTLSDLVQTTEEHHLRSKKHNETSQRP